MVVEDQKQSSMAMDKPGSMTISTVTKITLIRFAWAESFLNSRFTFGPSNSAFKALKIVRNNPMGRVRKYPIQSFHI